MFISILSIHDKRLKSYKLQFMQIKSCFLLEVIEEIGIIIFILVFILLLWIKIVETQTIW